MEGTQQGHRFTAASALGLVARLFPTVAPAQVQAVLDLIPLEKKSLLATGEEWAVPSLLSLGSQLIAWQGGQVAIPYRVYFQEPFSALRREPAFAKASRRRAAGRVNLI